MHLIVRWIVESLIRVHFIHSWWDPGGTIAVEERFESRDASTAILAGAVVPDGQRTNEICQPTHVLRVVIWGHGALICGARQKMHDGGPVEYHFFTNQLWAKSVGQ